MKKTCLSAVTFLACAMICAQAGDFIYNSEVGDWFKPVSGGLPAWKVEQNKNDSGAFLNLKVPPSNAICVVNTNANWQVLQSHYAGARWEAPEGQVIVDVKLVFHGVYGIGDAPQMFVFAGPDSANEEVYRTDLEGDYSRNEQTAALHFDVSDNYRTLEIRNWYCEGSQVVQSGWDSTVASVEITTAPAAGK